MFVCNNLRWQWKSKPLYKNNNNNNNNLLLLLWQLQGEEIELLVVGSKKHPQKNQIKQEKTRELEALGGAQRKKKKIEKKKDGE